MIIKEKEIWKPIFNYEEYYMISSWGRLLNLERKVRCKNNKYRIIKEKILTNLINNSGYQIVNLSKYNKQKIFKINRLVAIHFIPNPENKPQVNHLDGNKINDYYKNLEWCTSKENIKHAWKLGLCENTRSSAHSSKKTYCVQLDELFESTLDAAKKLNISNGNISKCCRDIRKSAGKHPETNEPLTWKFI